MTGYERVKESEKYYHINATGETHTDFEDNDNFNNDLYSNANYYSDETVAENNARADKLMRQLRRFAVEHNDCELDWSNDEQTKCYIFYNYNSTHLNIGCSYVRRDFGQIYFLSDKVAKQAIKEFEDELIWYFTEYQDHFADDSKKVKEKCGCELCSSGNLVNVGISGDRIALWGGNNRPEKEQKLKYCSNCGRKLED